MVSLSVLACSLIGDKIPSKLQNFWYYKQETISFAKYVALRWECCKALTIPCLYKDIGGILQRTITANIVL